ncbi:DMT family transporter [Marivita hallyeonensis]|uniref:Threonine/homoserine efflux transporter RhtA n=1 Tax=Marivita hallyeonensis TaxID=996342 RepID=A0A1M5XFF5_9RHOB|nr:DMT family transporter [Marivita hallyeonensis]SHH98244.1 Threonine/homoserine efflux transporter RhtA [Marivita hallyeonensis]
MRLVLLASLTMIAFASNSILNRVGITSGEMDAVSFGILRLISGAVMLAALVMLRSGRLSFGGDRRWAGVSSLLAYTFCFSLAYESLDAGLGALILFGMVQITMFGGALVSGERPAAQRWFGATLAFAGLVWLLWPGHAAAPSLAHALSMAVAGAAWGVYSLNGRGGRDPLGATAANFVIAAAIVSLFGLGQLAMPGSAGIPTVTGFGVAIAVLCGAVTSGLGYALWYTVLPSLRSTTAAVAQLTVPVIAMAAGAVFLSEAVGFRLIIAACIVLGGVLLAVTSRR